MGRFTKLASDAFDALQLDAGVLLSSFDPTDPEEPASADIIATTSGGIQISCEAEYSDFFEDVDNAPNNTMEGKHLDGWNCSMSFTSIKFNASNTAWSLGPSTTTSGTGYKKIVPNRSLATDLSDFQDIWWVGDKANGGAYAVCLKNALSTGGLSIQTSKNGKGTNSVTLTGHVSIAAQDVVPMEFYDFDPLSSGDAPTYTKVSPVGSENPRNEGWYVLVGDRYVLTTDTVVDSNVDYYEMS